MPKWLLVFLLTILIDLKACEKGLKKLIKIDKSKIPVWSCNDHLERLKLNVNFVNNSIDTTYSVDDQFVIEYSYDKCNNEAGCVYQKLTEFNSKNASFRLILNVYYEYKFEIFLINKQLKVNNSSNETDSTVWLKKVCLNHLNFIRFKNCDEYEFNIGGNGNCSLDFIKQYNSNNLAIYVYFLIVILLVITISAIIGKFFVNKYRRLR